MFNIKKKRMKKLVLFSSFIIVGVLMITSMGIVPSVANAAPTTTTTQSVCAGNSLKDITGVVNWASCFLLKTVVPFLFALATAAFIWGVIQFYLNPDNEEKRKKGKSFIIGGLIALFVMLSMWGLVAILTGTFGLTNTIPQLPQ
ncbi:MAG: hypothetical protein WCT42_01950 [Candidatus Paceibacterota bacterium]|jgi:hypothetical protein